jgi:hypothetical protein
LTKKIFALIWEYDNYFKICNKLQQFALEEAFQGMCFEHAMSKAYQYGIVNEKVSFGLHEISIKFAQTNF